jgi:ParB/RepB/Spo0J family partition protein
VSSVQDIPLENIRESGSNPRRVFDEAQLRELAANIQSHGVLQAILVRPLEDGANDVYELVAGARRFRASKLAGKRTIPATVRHLTDAEAQEIRLIENLQRTNIHELDEGKGEGSAIHLNVRMKTHFSRSLIPSTRWLANSWKGPAVLRKRAIDSCISMIRRAVFVRFLCVLRVLVPPIHSSRCLRDVRTCGLMICAAWWNLSES